MATPTRRRFLQAAVGAALPFVADAAQDPPASADQALLAIARLRFKHLTEEQLKAVGGSLRIGLAGAEILKRVRLEPTDEPATVFVADPVE
ncbi:MAG: hypothetical protein EXR98_23920 [Gemmataceae bacterium]|nr:hypothetical protein [Gemmataceae bacterium]